MNTAIIEKTIFSSAIAIPHSQEDEANVCQKCAFDVPNFKQNVNQAKYVNHFSVNALYCSLW